MTKQFYDERYGVEYKQGLLSPDNVYKLEKSLDFVLQNDNITFALDIGCNPKMTNIIRKRTKAHVFGLNISDDIMVKDIDGIDWVIYDANEGLPFKDNNFNFIFAGEVIEHIFDADKFISEIIRVSVDDAWLVLTTPNLASLWNRIFLMFGLQPHLFGVSRKKSYGNPFLKYDRFCGHVKLFTYKAMKEFLDDNFIKVEKTFGVHIYNPNDGKLKKFIRRIGKKFPSLAEDVVYICRVVK